MGLQLICSILFKTFHFHFDCSFFNVCEIIINTKTIVSHLQHIPPPLVSLHVHSSDRLAVSHLCILVLWWNCFCGDTVVPIVVKFKVEVNVIVKNAIHTGHMAELNRSPLGPIYYSVITERINDECSLL